MRTSCVENVKSSPSEPKGLSATAEQDKGPAAASVWMLVVLILVNTGENGRAQAGVSAAHV